MSVPVHALLIISEIDRGVWSLIESQGHLFTQDYVSPADVEDLRLCGSVASCCWWRKVFYRMKDHILQNFGTREGFALQKWDDLCWKDDPDDPNDRCCQGATADGTIPYATHYHILERWSLGGRILHRPTNEYRYKVWCYDASNAFSKESDYYMSLVSQCTGDKIEGRKKIVWENKAPAWRAFLRLGKRFRGVVGKDGSLENVSKEMR